MAHTSMLSPNTSFFPSKTIIHTLLGVIAIVVALYCTSVAFPYVDLGFAPAIAAL